MKYSDKDRMKLLDSLITQGFQDPVIELSVFSNDTDDFN